jgi:hypothetical protein
MKPERTKPAGGAKKNRLARERLVLPAGTYEAWYVTDDSHHWSAWNQPPPRDPGSWGMTVRLLPGPGGDLPYCEADLPVFDAERDVVAMRQAGDDSFQARSLVLRRDSAVWVYAIGEQARGRLTDWGWIVDTRSGEVAWEMEAGRCLWAGGANKNRYCDEAVPLAAGEYVVAYATDDSHSAGGGWNSTPPWDRERAGMTVSRLVGRGEENDFLGFPPERSSRLLALIAGVGDREDRTVRFELPRPTRVLVVCQGEGTPPQSMHDFGWLEREGGGRVWALDYATSQHAGGAAKNREWRGVLTLPAGSYLARYVSDGSHSFNRWNDDPPRHAGAQWGLAVFLAE